MILRHEKLVLPRRVSRPLQEADAGKVTLVFLPQMPDQPRWEFAPSKLGGTVHFKLECAGAVTFFMLVMPVCQGGGMGGLHQGHG